MKHTYLRQSLIASTLATTLLVASAENPANQFIHLAYQTDSDSQSECTQRDGQRVYVVNTHTESVIDVHIDRFFSGVRQAGRSMFAIAPGHRQALGCDTVMGNEQRWELMKADFIDKQFALERYGQIIGEP
jgi:hypothetical protein